MISREEAEDYAKKNGLLYVEASAKSNINVQESFLEPARAILQKVKDKVIDPKIEEYGVRRTGGDLVSYEEFDQLMKKSRKKKKNCKC